MMLLLWKKLGGGEPAHETAHPLLGGPTSERPFARAFTATGAAAAPAPVHPHKEQR